MNLSFASIFGQNGKFTLWLLGIIDVTNWRWNNDEEYGFSWWKIVLIGYLDIIIILSDTLPFFLPCLCSRISTGKVEIFCKSVFVLCLVQEFSLENFSKYLLFIGFWILRVRDQTCDFFWRRVCSPPAPPPLSITAPKRKIVHPMMSRKEHVDSASCGIHGCSKCALKWGKVHQNSN